MKSETSMERLRRANPVAVETRTDERLFDAIVATPRHPHAAGRASARLNGRKIQRLAVLGTALVFGAGAAWATGSGPLELFQSNPQAPDAAPTSVWNQDVVPSSVVQAAVLSIPRYGDVQFWYADASQGGWCGALRLPDGSWAATKGSATSGTAPGCYPTRTQINGDDPVYVINGFDYYEVQVDARRHGGAFWRIHYGVLSVERPVARLVDRISGRRAHLHDHTAFAIAIPDHEPDRAAPLPGYALHLVAYDSDGKVVADEHPNGR